MPMSKKTIKTVSSVVLVVTLSGCAATEVALEHRNLDVKTHMSRTIYLDPVAASKKTVFIAMKNTSDQEMDIHRPLAQALMAKGYKVVSNPISAHYLIQANILQIGKSSQSASKMALGGGFGSALVDAGTGAAVGAFSGNANAMLAGGIAGGFVGMVADALVKDVNYTMITDVQISERAGKGIKVNEQFQSHLKNGSSTVTSQTSSRTSLYHRYRTRVVSNADKINLKFSDARASLEQGLIKVISGIF